MSNKLFILCECIDEGVIRMWHFQVDSKREMAQYIIDHIDNYDEMFKGITWHSGMSRWRRREEHTPETFLQAIDKTSIDSDSESGFQIHALDLTNNGSRAEEVTWYRPQTDLG